MRDSIEPERIDAVSTETIACQLTSAAWTRSLDVDEAAGAAMATRCIEAMKGGR